MRSQAEERFSKNPADAATESRPDGPAPARIFCRKCAFLNESHRETCTRCGHSLYVKCQCGARNVRSNDRCIQCGHRLRGRHIDWDDPFFDVTSPKSPGSVGRSSGGHDLAVSLAVLVVTALVVVSILGLARNWDASAHGEPTPTDAEQETRNQMGKEFVIISLLVAGSAVGALVFSSIRGRPGRGTR